MAESKPSVVMGIVAYVLFTIVIVSFVGLRFLSSHKSHFKRAGLTVLYIVLALGATAIVASILSWFRDFLQ